MESVNTTQLMVEFHRSLRPDSKNPGWNPKRKPYGKPP
jgi:hypothetical protein